MRFRILFLLPCVLLSTPMVRGDDGPKPKLTPALDIYSAYVWRGSLYGTGPAFQPSLGYSKGGFAAGVWGSFDLHGYKEADPYLSYEFPSGLSLGITDYYYPVLKLDDFSAQTGSHALELNTGYSLKAFSFSANYIMNEAGGAGSSGNDLYFEAGYSKGIFSAFLGAGDGWHTSTGKFNVCNAGIAAVKKIRIGESFSFSVSGQIIVNPERERLYLVAGISF